MPKLQSTKELSKVLDILKAMFAQHVDFTETSADKLINDIKEKGIEAFPSLNMNVEKEMELEDEDYGTAYINDYQVFFFKNVGKLIKCAEQNDLKGFNKIFDDDKFETSLGELKNSLVHSGLRNNYSAKELYTMIPLFKFFDDFWDDHEAVIESYNKGEYLKDNNKFVRSEVNEVLDETGKNIEILNYYRFFFHEYQTVISINAKEKNINIDDIIIPYYGIGEMASEDLITEVNNNPYRYILEFKEKINKAIELGVADGLLEKLPDTTYYVKDEKFVNHVNDIKNNLKNAQLEQGKPKKEAPAEINDRPAFRKKEIDFATLIKGQVTQSILELESSKTFVNSTEYKELITSLKELHDSNIADKKAFEEKLGNIGKKIDDYINHKAKDGVKPNAYKKLAAVQHADEWISKTLKQLDLSNTEVRNSEPKYEKLKDTDKEMNPLTEKARENVKKLTGDVKINDQTIVRADKCMCKIIINADKDKKAELINIRSDFNGGLTAKAPVKGKEGITM